MIPKNITKEHLDKAILEIDEKGIRKGRQSSTYDLMLNGKRYPPKLVVSIANRFANGKELESDEFEGGQDTSAFILLKNNGFEIVKKVKSEDYSIVNEYISNVRSGSIKAMDSIKKLIASNNFEERLHQIDKIFFNSKLSDINATNYLERIEYIKEIHSISGNYNNFNIWSASKNQLSANNRELLPQHEELNKLVGFADNQNGIYKSFIGEKNLIAFLKEKFTSSFLNRKSIYENLRSKLENVGFEFESEQKAHRQNREENELKFIHPQLINKLEANGYSVNAKKFYIKPLSDETDCEIGFVTGKSSPLISENIFSQANTIDSYDNNPAWTNRTGDTALDNLLKSISKFLNKTENDMKFPLNTILYGPPGTGKTYNTILRAAEIVENRKIDSYDEALKIFNDNLHNRIEFITFHQNYSYEDFIQGLRPETDNKSSLTFEKKDGVFKRIADRAKQNSYYIPVGTEFKDYTVIKSNEDIVELWSERTKSIRYVPLQLIIDLYEGIKSNKITLEDIKKRKDIDLPELINSKVEKYYFGIEGTLYNICEYLIKNEKSNNSLNYVIIIDEINRANISRVFGELITLIEPDKRSNGLIPLHVKLPSGDSFNVPSNLYIIGTMNTADKSIALLDIALRRRFEFESMYPLYEIEGSEIYDKGILLKINEQIIKSKGHDFQIGHAYFMGENKDLIQRMNKKVIPLLLEYFMNDEKEVKGILFNAGLQVEENAWPIKITGKRA